MCNQCNSDLFSLLKSDNKFCHLSISKLSFVGFHQWLVHPLPKQQHDKWGVPCAWYFFLVEAMSDMPQNPSCASLEDDSVKETKRIFLTVKWDLHSTIYQLDNWLALHSPFICNCQYLLIHILKANNICACFHKHWSCWIVNNFNYLYICKIYGRKLVPIKLCIVSSGILGFAACTPEKADCMRL